MQLWNKKVISSKLAYTWYVYPAVTAISFFTWFWSFGLFHQPSQYQKITVFFGANVNDNSFTDSIKNKFDEEKLELFEVNGCSPDKSIYAQKLNVYLSNADIVILPEYEVDAFAKDNAQPKEVMENYFLAIDKETKTAYFDGVSSYYDLVDSELGTSTTYGVQVKNKDAGSWLDSYINFEANTNYYALLTSHSVNAGNLYEEGNAQNDNALVVLNYLVGGIK